MPVALKDQLKKIFLMLINKPSELTGRSHHIAPLADLLKKRHEEIYLQVEQLKLELQEKFKKDLIFQKKLYQALTSYCEITEQKLPDREELNNDTRLANIIGANLKNYALLADSALTLQQYDEKYNISAAADIFVHQQDLYDNYLRAIMDSSYYVFFEEISILASLRNVNITVFRNNVNLDQIVFSPIPEIADHFQQVTGIHKPLPLGEVAIYHRGMHYCKANHKPFVLAVTPIISATASIASSSSVPERQNDQCNDPQLLLVSSDQEISFIIPLTLERLVNDEPIKKYQEIRSRLVEIALTTDKYEDVIRQLREKIPSQEELIDQIDSLHAEIERAKKEYADNFEKIKIENAQLPLIIEAFSKKSYRWVTDYE